MWKRTWRQHCSSAKALCCADSHRGCGTHDLTLGQNLLDGNPKASDVKEHQRTTRGCAGDAQVTPQTERPIKVPGAKSRAWKADLAVLLAVNMFEKSMDPYLFIIFKFLDERFKFSGIGVPPDSLFMRA